MDDNYDDEGMTPNNPTAQAEPETEHKEGDSNDAIIPKTLLAGKDFKVGDEVCLEITAIHEDDIAVRYSTKGDDREDPSSPMQTTGESSMYD